MSYIATLRPSSQNAADQYGLTNVGVGTSWGCLADSLDSSYVLMDAKAQIVVNFPLPISPTPPGLTTNKLGHVRFRIRCKRAPQNTNVTNPYLVASLDGNNAQPSDERRGGIDMDTSVRVHWGAPQTIHPPGPYPMRGVPLKAEPTFLRMTLTRNDDLQPPWTSHDIEVALYVYAVFVDVIYPDRAAARVPLPLTGSTITDDNTPRVRWVPSLDPEGGPQDASQVKVFTAAQYGAGGFDPSTSTETATSGIVDGAGRIWDPPDQLDDATYRAYVRVAQTFGDGARYWSNWASTASPLPYSQFTLLTSKPYQPTLVATAQVASGRIKLDVTKGTGSGGLATQYYQLQSSTDGGTTWTFLRTPFDRGFYTAAAGTTTLYDYEPPNGDVTKYRVRAVYHVGSDPVDDPGVVNVFSAWSAIQTATLSTTDWWIKHPFDRTKSKLVTIKSQPGRSRTARQGVFQPLGRSLPVVISDTPSSYTGELVVRCDSDTERRDLADLVDDGVPLLIQAPVTVQDWPTVMWVVIGDQTRERLIDVAWSKITYETLQWVQVGKPAGRIWFE